MFWKCSFQRVYRRVSGSADSKGVREWRRVTNKFAEPNVAAPSLCIVSCNFRIAAIRPESRILLPAITFLPSEGTGPAYRPLTGRWVPRACASRLPRNYFSFAYSALAAMKIGMSGSASFHSVRKSWYAARALAVSPCNT